MVKRLSELTYPEAEAARAQPGVIALLPIGSTEAHGPHLPLATDAIISDELALRAGRALAARGRPVVLLPTISFAVTEFARPFAGTLSIRPETATALVADVCVAAIEQGFQRVCLVNSHLEPAHVATLAAAVADAGQRSGHPVAFANNLERRFARTLSDEFKRGACHAGSYETSLVLAAGRSVGEVRRSLPPLMIELHKQMQAGVRDFRAAGAADAYFGDPAAASVAEGEAQFALLVDMVVTVALETWP